MDVIVEVDPQHARKRPVRPSDWTKNVCKKQRYKAKALPQYPPCKHATKSYRCGTLSMEDIKLFHEKFYKLEGKILQDNFILKYSTVSTVRRIRNATSNRPHTMATTYYIAKKDKKVVPVCKAAFLGILNLKRYRVEGILARFLHKDQMPEENRGGDHRSFKTKDIRENVVTFIKSFCILEKHYCRGRSQRQYVSSDLSIRKMWQFYNEKHPDKECRESFFRVIFNTKFNIGFNAPQVDVCSYCLEYKGKIKSEKDPSIKQKLDTQLKVHKMRAKAFVNLLKKEESHVIAMSYDCEKNLVLPKIPDQITYYKRQLYLYNFTVVIGSSKGKMTKQNVLIHTWLESESSKGSNEIASAVYNTLKNLDISEDVRVIRLFADGCAGQNKNSTMIGMCAKWLVLDAPGHITTVDLIFPVTGHSFIPPDRVFGLIEKQIKKKDTIIDVNDYYNTFKNFGTVKKLGEDWDVLDWRTEIAAVMKPTSSLHFKINSCKRIILTKSKKGNILVRGEPNYNSEINNAQSICKRGKQICSINPLPMELNKVKLNPDKITNINELLSKHFGIDWKKKAAKENLMYYKNLIARCEAGGEENGNDDDEDGNDLCEQIDVADDTLV